MRSSHPTRAFRWTMLPLLVLFLTAIRAAATPPADTKADSPAHTTAARPKDSTRWVSQQIAREPITFFPVTGGKDVGAYESRLPNYDLQIRSTGMTIRSQQVLPPASVSKPAFEAGGGVSAEKPQVVRHQTSVEFVGANQNADLEALEPGHAHVNRFIGKDPSQWQRDLPTYGRVRTRELYPGIDLIYYGGGQGSLEYDLVVGPRADLKQVRLRSQGDDKAVLEADGSLDLDGKGGSVRLQRPVLYQDENGSRKAVAGSFVQLAPGEFGFQSAAYDHTRPLIVDPTIKLIYATYAGGIHNELEYGLALDASGNAYIVGESASQDFPITGNALQTTRQAIGVYAYDAVILKFDASGNLVFSTFLGGYNNDEANAIVVGTDGTIYVGGQTQSTDFPVTSNAYQKTWGGGQDAFFAKISNDGSQLLYSTYLGASADETIQNLILNTDGTLWIGGTASGPGLTPSATAYQKTAKGADDYFIAKAQFDQTGALSFPYLTFLGGTGNGQELGFIDMTTDTAGNIYVAGGTTSADYPVTTNAYEKPFTTSGGCYNTQLPNTIGTLSKLSPDLSQLLYSTVIGGHIEDQNGYPDCNQFVRTVHVDAQGNIWAIGTTGMSDFPTTSNAMSKQLNGNGYAGVDDFITEFSADGTKLLYSTYFGGSQFDYGARAVWDPNGNIWMVTATQSTDYPVTPDALQPANAGGYDAGITEFSPDATTILYSTYLGGSSDDDINGSAQIRLDPQGNIRITGTTSSNNYPVTASATQPLYANGDQSPDGYDLYYVNIGSGAIATISPASFGNNGDATLSIAGAGFEQGATCQLVLGATTVAATVVSVNSGGTAINCSFPLTGVAAGSYSVVVSNPNGGSSFTKSDAVTVASGGQPNISAQVIGRAAVRIGSPSTFYITVTNSGSQDGYVVPLWITLPTSVTFSINGYSQALSASLATTVGDTAYVQLLLPDVPAGKTLSIPLQITAPVGISSAALPITASVQAPWFGTLADLNAAGTDENYDPYCAAGATPAYQNCLGAYISIFAAGNVATSMAVVPAQASGVRPEDTAGDACKKLNAFQQAYQDGMKDAATDIKNGNQNAFNPPKIGTDGAFIGYTFGYATGIENAVAGFAGSLGHVVTVPVAQMSALQVSQLLQHRSLNNTSLIRPFAALPRDTTTCPANPPPPPPPSIPPVSGVNPQPVGAIDPNEKSGSPGDGSASRFIPAGAGLPYLVGFENKPTATAPASQVIVTDQLDPTKVNLATVTLGNIYFGTNVITPPTGVNNYNTTYTLSSTLVVRIQGSLNTDTGLLKWTFTSIDPSTGQPPTDPTVGFLPPDTDGVIGQGGVVFNVLPVAGLTTGTAIPNTATVIFDANAPISTPTWTNSLDVDAPVSTVSALPAVEVPATNNTTLAFPVSWSGTDQGSGIASYSIFVSDNGGAFLPWLTAVTSTTANYTGTAGHTYGFYSIATDAAGNVQAAKTTADTTTTVSSPGSTTSTLSVSPTSASVGASITLSVTVAPTTGSGTPTGQVTFMDGATTVLGTATLSSGKASLTTTALALGGHTITAVYGGDSTYVTSTSSSITVTITPAPPDFSVTLSLSNATISGSGGSTSTTITLAPSGGFTGSIALSCGGLPAHSTCTFNPASLTASGTTTTSVMTITTNTASASVTRKDGSGVMLAFLGGGLFGLSLLRGRKRLSQTLALVCLLCVGWAISGCAGKSPSTSTPAGSYPVTVTATSGSTVHSATFNLTVQ